MAPEILTFSDRAQWLALREKDVTASDIAAVCGVSPWQTPRSVWARKLGLILLEETNLMKRGRWMEHAILAALRETRPEWDIRKATVYVRDSDLRLGCTPDLIVDDPERDGIGSVQMKTVSARSFNRRWRNEAGDTEVPLYVQLQALMEGRLVGADWIAVAAFVVGEMSGDLHVIDVEDHAAAWDRIKREAAQFLWHLDNEVPPPIMPWRDLDTVRAMYPAEEEGKALDLSAKNELPAMLAERAALTASIKDAKDRIDEINTEIMDDMKLAEIATLPGWKITWKTQHRKAFTVNESDMRVLRVSKSKEQ